MGLVMEGGILAVVGGGAALYYYPFPTLGVIAGQFVAMQPGIGVSSGRFSFESYLPYWIGGGIAGHYVGGYLRNA